MVIVEDELKEKLLQAKTLNEVKELLKYHPELDAERIFDEVEHHRGLTFEKLDLDELDAVSGGADRDWMEDGCARTCTNSGDKLCWANDWCMVWDVTYTRFYATCPDGSSHDFDWTGICKKCGYGSVH